jgi:hypothetical protein
MKALQRPNPQRLQCVSGRAFAMIDSVTVWSLASRAGVLMQERKLILGDRD